MTLQDQIVSHLQSLTELTDENLHEAQLAARVRGYLNLDKLIQISDRAALILSQHAGPLSLSGIPCSLRNIESLEELTDSDVRETLLLVAQAKCGLNLPSVRRISDSVARVLGNLDYGSNPCLRLDAVSELSDDAFCALTQFRGELALNGLTSISSVQLEALRRHRVGMETRLAGLHAKLANRRVLTDCEDDLRLLSAVTFDSWGIDLPSLEEISKRGAEILFSYYGTLNIKQLKHLPEIASDKLEGFEGDLYLNNLNHISDSHLITLLKCTGTGEGHILYLNSLKSIPESALPAIAQHKGQLSFNGLETLSLDSATAFGSSRWDFNTSRTETLSPEYHPNSGEYSIYLNGIRKLSESTATALSKHQGSISLTGLEEISESVAEALAQHGINELGDYTLSLNLGAPILTPSAATNLAKYRGESIRFGFCQISEEIAAALSSYHGCFCFDELTPLPASVALALSKHEGDSIYFNALTSSSDFSDEAAWALSRYQGGLNLNRLTDISDEQAEALSQHKGRTLSLLSLKSFSDRAAQMLSGKLNKTYDSLIARRKRI